MAIEETMSEQEIEQLYKDLHKFVSQLGFGYGENGGAELVMLKRFYTPQDAKYFMDMPTDSFFTAAEFAEIEGLSEEESKEVLEDMARRANIYHEVRDDGVDYYRVIPAAHGIYEFHTRWLEPEWVGPLLSVMADPGSATLTFNSGVPFYHTMPIDPSYVKGEGILPEDDLWTLLASKRRYCVAPCDCLATGRDMFTPGVCEHPTGVCIQTDKMADYYLDYLQTGEEITYEEAKKIMEDGIARGLVPQTTYSKDTEIFCSCGLCHCGILQMSKGFPGDANANQTHYVLVHDPDKCLKCGACAKVCPMISIAFEAGEYPVTDASCVSCGQCIKACPAEARWLERKPDTESRDYAETMWDSYNMMQEHRKAMGRL